MVCRGCFSGEAEFPLAKGIIPAWLPPWKCLQKCHMPLSENPSNPHPTAATHKQSLKKKNNTSLSFSNSKPETYTETHQRLSDPPQKSFRDSREGKKKWSRIRQPPQPLRPGLQPSNGMQGTSREKGGGSKADLARRYLEPILAGPPLPELPGRAGVSEGGLPLARPSRSAIWPPSLQEPFLNFPLWSCPAQSMRSSCAGSFPLGSVTGQGQGDGCGRFPAAAAAASLACTGAPGGVGRRHRDTPLQTLPTVAATTSPGACTEAQWEGDLGQKN